MQIAALAVFILVETFVHSTVCNVIHDKNLDKSVSHKKLENRYLISESPELGIQSRKPPTSDKAAQENLDKISAKLRAVKN